MKRKKSLNPLIIIGIVAGAVVVVIVVCRILGIDLFATLTGELSSETASFENVDDLESGRAYVWHHENGDKGKDIFYSCIKGNNNFKNKETEEEIEHPRSIWISTDIDECIPTVIKEDKLIYVSDTEIPDEIIFERFADYGYSIGVSNMVSDSGGHYYIEYAEVEDDDYKYYIDTSSDAEQLCELEAVSKLYLDKVGEDKVIKKNVSYGGTVLGLKKNKNYVCEFYTGTYYQDFKMRADVHTFSSMERFISNEYEFMHSNFIVISLPDYLKSGYYFVNGVGLFRYVDKNDEGKYTGKAYDESIDWNRPIIVYNEAGEVIENPSDPDFIMPGNELEESDLGVAMNEESKKSQ